MSWIDNVAKNIVTDELNQIHECLHFDMGSARRRSHVYLAHALFACKGSYRHLRRSAVRDLFKLYVIGY